MGEGYDWVNVDKREYLDPVDFNMGYKLRESMWTGDRFYWQDTTITQRPHCRSFTPAVGPLYSY